jgi:hypothetical protein
LLSTALALAPVHAAVKAAANGMKRSVEDSAAAEAESAAWLTVRQALAQPEEKHRLGAAAEPWWWLRLIGCQDPKGFYTRYRLAPDAPDAPSAEAVEASANNAQAAASAADAAEAPAASNDFAGESPHDDRTADAQAYDDDFPDASRGATPAPAGHEGESGADDTYMFEGEDQATPQKMDRTFEDSQAEQDPYNATFDTEDAQSPGGQPLSPTVGAYSQDDFENENDARTPVAKAAEETDGAEFEDDFEQGDESPPPTADADDTAGFEQSFVAPDDEAHDRELDTRQSTQGFDDFEDDDAVPKRGRSTSKYSSGEFEFEGEESPKAPPPAADANYAGDFEEDDEYGDFEKDD